MNKHDRGASTVGIVAVIVVIAVAGFAVAYFGSDVFRTKTNAQLTQFTQWTPENIAADPVNYLNFCEEQTELAKQKAKASKIAISQKTETIKVMHQDATTKSSVGTKALDDLKAAYKAAETDDKFPINWQGKQLDKEAAKRQILRLAGEIKSKKNLIAKLDNAIATLRVQSNKIADAQNKADAQLAEIKANREMLRVQEITDKITQDLVDMKGAIQSTLVGIDNTSDESVSLDQLAAQSEATVDDDEFNKVLNE